MTLTLSHFTLQHLSLSSLWKNLRQLFSTKGDVVISHREMVLLDIDRSAGPGEALSTQTYTLYVTVHEPRLAPFCVKTKLCTVCLPAVTPDC